MAAIQGLTNETKSFVPAEVITGSHHLCKLNITKTYWDKLVTCESSFAHIAAKATLAVAPLFILLTLLADGIIALADYLSNKEPSYLNIPLPESPKLSRTSTDEQPMKAKANPLAPTPTVNADLPAQSPALAPTELSLLSSLTKTTVSAQTLSRVSSHASTESLSERAETSLPTTPKSNNSSPVNHDLHSVIEPKAEIVLTAEKVCASASATIVYPTPSFDTARLTPPKANSSAAQDLVNAGNRSEAAPLALFNIDSKETSPTNESDPFSSGYINEELQPNTFDLHQNLASPTTLPSPQANEGKLPNKVDPQMFNSAATLLQSSLDSPFYNQLNPTPAQANSEVPITKSASKKFRSEPILDSEIVTASIVASTTYQTNAAESEGEQQVESQVFTPSTNKHIQEAGLFLAASQDSSLHNLSFPATIGVASAPSNILHFADAAKKAEHGSERSYSSAVQLDITTEIAPTAVKSALDSLNAPHDQTASASSAAASNYRPIADLEENPSTVGKTEKSKEAEVHQVTAAGKKKKKKTTNKL